MAEGNPVRWSIIQVLSVFLMALIPRLTLAGGSGLNICVVVNPNSPNSLALGNYYCERRHVPPQNVVRMQNWTGGNVAWTRGQMEQALVAPMLAQLTARGLTAQIDYVLLSMDIPYQVAEAGSVNSTTSAIFYGFKPNTAPAGFQISCSIPAFSSNSYAFSEALFRDRPPDTASLNPFLAMMLTARDLGVAELTVDQGVISDGTFPAGTVYLARTFDGLRSVRSVLFDDAIFDTSVQGTPGVVRTNQDSPYGLTGLLGYQTGLAQFSILPKAFLPGAMADSMTSFGGVILQDSGQTSLLAFLEAGATGSYGTVIEPCANLNKFPSPRNYFYQARGFSLAESYYQSLRNPYQGLLVGEPLASPFARRGAGSWVNLPSGAALRGNTNLLVQFTSSDPSRPLAQVDVFLDGTFLQTITNIPPRENDRLSVDFNGGTVSYSVPSNATLQSAAAGLAEIINSASNGTYVTASAVGDRIALRSTDPIKSGSEVSIFVRSSTSSGSSPLTLVRASRTNFLDTAAFALGSFEVAYTTTSLGDWMQLNVIKTNGTQFAMSATNDDANGTVTFAQNLKDQVNGNPALQGPDGVVADVLPLSDTSTSFVFTLQARAPGLAPSQIQAVLSASSTNFWLRIGTNKLDTNLSDIQPRNHLYVTSGVTNLVAGFQFDTSGLADGHHELTAVAYEGSHARTQTAATQSVLISNSPFATGLNVLVGDTNSALESSLIFGVSANTNAVVAIELFSTGGSLGVISNQASATFSIPGTYLGVGLHPVYAIATDTSGSQYRTETKWIRLVNEESPFEVATAGSPLLLSWPALAGRHYDVLSADSLTNAFQLRQTIVPTNDLGRWRESTADAPERFYRIRSSW